jgi:hypothetical protein
MENPLYRLKFDEISFPTPPKKPLVQLLDNNEKKGKNKRNHKLHPTFVFGVNFAL